MEDRQACKAWRVKGTTPVVLKEATQSSIITQIKRVHLKAVLSMDDKPKHLPHR